ncbi:hypothetical protein COV24_00295, partial [candidate division WWE3 bacterium CG10_big_fil_rev_8_21_14_0_10_32_10]
MKLPKTKLIPTDKVIEIAKSNGVYFGFGDPKNRIRYLIKKGLLPYQIRKQKNNKIVSYLPDTAIERLIEINELQENKKYTIPKVIEYFENKKKASKEKLIVETRGVNKKETILKNIPTQKRITPQHRNELEIKDWNKQENPQKLQILSLPSFKDAYGNNKAKIAKGIKIGSYITFFVILTGILVNSGTILKSNIYKISSGFNQSSNIKNPQQSTLNNSLATKENIGKVLAEATDKITPFFKINIPTTFNESTQFNKDITVEKLATFNNDINAINHNLDLGTGQITASNIIYSISGGDGISVSTGQNPQIANTGVLSLGGISGNLNLGDGIEINNSAISNTGVLSIGGETGDVTLSAGNGISISGNTITNSDRGSNQDIFKSFTFDGTKITAGANDDSITFSGGTGITLATSGNTVTITGAIGENLSTGTTIGDILYGSASDTLSKLSIGTTGKVLTVSAGGIPSWADAGLTAVKESGGTVNTSTATTLDFLGTDFDLIESPAGEINVQLASQLTTPTSVAGNWDVAGTLVSGTGDAFQVSTTGGITIPVTEDITFGTIGLNDTGTSSVTSGASRVGVYDEFTNSTGTNVQEVLDDLDAAIGSGASKWTQQTGYVYLSNTTDDIVVGGSTTSASGFYTNVSAGDLFLGTNSSIDGSLTLYSSGSGITDPSLTANSSGDLVITP